MMVQVLAFIASLQITVDCGHPPVFLDGTVSYLNTTEGSEAHYHCDDGFTLEGEMTAVCRADGRWNSTPVCRQTTGSTVEPPLSGLLANGQLPLLGNWPHKINFLYLVCT